ncbi:MAG: hypothetical protein ACREKS_01225 [Candidatus Rokuibacteriota bacterium]
MLEDGQQEGGAAVADDEVPVQLEPRLGLDGGAKYVAADTLNRSRRIDTLPWSA